LRISADILEIVFM